MTIYQSETAGILANVARAMMADALRYDATVNIATSAWGMGEMVVDTRRARLASCDSRALAARELKGRLERAEGLIRRLLECGCADDCPTCTEARTFITEGGV